MAFEKAVFDPSFLDLRRFKIVTRDVEIRHFNSNDQRIRLMKNISATARWLIPMAMVCPLACTPTAAPPPIPIGKAAVNAAVSQAQIDEIVLERFGHRPGAPFYKVVLRQDGTVTYTGQFNVSKIGTFDAKIELRDFRRLEEMIDHLGYFEMKDAIFVIGDADSVRTSILRGGQRKTIEDGWGSTAPVELWTTEMAIDGLVAGITDWKTTK
jgi:Domain of unknown function (DUF6438)